MNVSINNKKRLLKVLLVGAFALLLIVTLALYFLSDGESSEVVAEEIPQQELEIDPSVLESAQSISGINQLEEAEAVFDPIVVDEQDPLVLTPVNQENQLVRQEEYKASVNVLAEPLLAIQSLSYLYNSSIEGILRGEEYVTEEIKTYLSLLKFSSEYLSSLDINIFVQEKTVMAQSLGSMSQSLEELLENNLDSEAAVSFSSNSATLNRMIVQVGQGVTANTATFRESEPGYLFVFEL